MKFLKQIVVEDRKDNDENTVSTTMTKNLNILLTEDERKALDRSATMFVNGHHLRRNCELLQVGPGEDMFRNAESWDRDMINKLIDSSRVSEVTSEYGDIGSFFDWEGGGQG